MAQQIINTGTAPNDGTGDTLKTSFTKTNQNFTELYAGAGSAGNVNNVGTPTLDQVAIWTDATHIKGVNTSTFLGAIRAGFRAHKNAVDQTGIASVTNTKVTMPTEDYDIGGYYDAANSRWMPPAGLIHIDAHLYLQNIGQQSSEEVVIFKNGAILKRGGDVNAAATGSGGYCQLSLDDNANGSDYYELYAYAGSAGTVTVNGLTAYTWWSGHLTGGPKGDTGATGATGGGDTAFRAGKSAAQSLASGTLTKITFNTEDYDWGGYYDNVNSRWTPPTGVIHLDVGLYASGVNAGSTPTIMIQKNGVEVKRAFVVAASSLEVQYQLSLDDYASGADVYEIYASGLGSPIVATGVFTFWSGHVVRGPKGDPGPTGLSGSVTGYLTPPQGRLTLVSSTPVMTASVASSTTIYYTNYVGNRISLWDNAAGFVMTSFGELSCVTSDVTKNPSAIGISKVNDWFVWNDNGTIRLSHGPDWTSDVARSAGTGLVSAGGIWLNNTAITNGPAAPASATATRSAGTYVGTTRSANGTAAFVWIFGSAGAVGAGSAFLNVWNAYNRVNVQTWSAETADSWTLLASWNVASAQRIWFVSGLAEDFFDCEYNVIIAPVAGYGGSGIGFDTGSAPSGIPGYMPGNTTGVARAKFTATTSGYHYLAPLEKGAGGGTVYGDAGAPADLVGAGIHFRMRM